MNSGPVSQYGWLTLFILLCVKYNYFCDDNLMGNVTLPLRIFLESMPRQTVGITGDDRGDDIMFTFTDASKGHLSKRS